jgi:hypothetical protein
VDDAARRWEIPVAVIDRDPRPAVDALLG